MSKSRRTSDRVLAAVLSFLMLFSVLPLNTVSAYRAVKTITVTVTDYWDNPVAGAEVIGYPAGLENECSETVQTDDDGKAVFTKFAEHVTDETEFEYSITKDGYEAENGTLSDTGDLFAGTYECQVKLLKQIEDYITVETYNDVYDGDEHGIYVTCSVADSVVEYFLPGDEDTILDTSPVYDKVGEYNICFRVKGPEGYSDYVNYDTYVRINAADITGVTVEALNTVYDGNEYPLVTVSGTAEGDITTCTIKGDEQIYKEIPEKDAAGNYEVTVTVDRGSNYNKFVQTVTAKIGLADLELGNIKIQGLEGVYTGEPQNAVTVTGQGDYTLEYKLDEGEWSDSIPTVEDAGSYRVQVKATKVNYKDEEVEVEAAESAVYPFNVYIAKADQSDFGFTNNTPAELVYEAILKNPATGGQSGGKITYEVVDGKDYVTVDEKGTVKANKAGGEATVKAVIAGNNNYNEAFATYKIRTVKAVQEDFAFGQSSYTVQYGTKALTVVASGGQSGGSVTYEITDSDIASVTTSENKGNIVFNSGKKGEVKIKATLDGGENYEDITVEATVNVISNDFSDKLIIEPDVPDTGWYIGDVTIKAAEGYKISYSGEFDAKREESIVVTAEGTKIIGDVYLIESDTEYISEAISVKDICIDKTAPNKAEISYKGSVLDTILNAVTFGLYDKAFGFYNSKAEVTITAYDNTSGIDHFTYSYTVSEGGHKEDAGMENVVISHGDDGFKNDGKEATAVFEIPAQFRGYVSFSATDKAGNTSDLFTDDKCIVVDDKEAVVNVTYDDGGVENEKYYNADRKAIISISADNFFPDSLYTPVLKNDENGNPVEQGENYLVIAVGKREYGAEKYEYTYKQPEFVRDGDCYKAVIDDEFNEELDYTFDIKYTDKSLNVYDDYEADEFRIDKTKPVLDVEFTEPPNSNGNQYRADRYATITIKENSDFNPEDVVVTVEASDAQGEIFDYAAYISDKQNWTSNGTEHTIELPFTTEAHYKFDIEYTDLAGNKSDDYEGAEFTIDKTAPDKMDITINGESVKPKEDTLAFEKFYSSGVTVKLSADCNISGKASFKYQKVADVSEYVEDKNNEKGVWLEYDDEKGIVVEPSEKFIIYFRAEDKAGNVSIIRSTGIVVDNREPEGEVMAPEIDIVPEQANTNGMYNGDVGVDFKIIDPKYIGNTASSSGYYSGLNKITYKIRTTDTDETETGTMFAVGETTDGAKFDSDGLANEWSGSITIDSAKFNSNNVIVEVTAVDNAGNTRTSATVAGDIKIDVTAPKIEVSYDNNDADSGSYFDKDRIATIVVEERNFREEDIRLSLTNTDGTVPELSEWTKTEGSGNLDNTKWTASINYSAEGDYDFSIEYTDPAGWTCGKDSVKYGSSMAPWQFTIDKTDPTVNVSYDNNSALNSNYYKDTRVATVAINEHNIDPNGADKDRIVITMSATDDGQDITVPTVSEWRTEGDTHTATINYSNDALYSFDIEIKDKAGNVSADFEEQSFYVDKTAPAVEITGVADSSANKAEVMPVVSYSDTNYDAEQVTITLTGANRNDVALEGSYTDIHNGRTFAFKNFAEEREIDDIYTLTATLTDKAGNTTTETVRFSVNRFGSTYGMSESAEKLNGTYVKEPVDVVVTETNVNELKNFKITLFKNNDTIVLQEGEDYKIEVTGGNGRWYYYTYTVFAKNFTDDGVYRLAFHSEDAAGNIAENTLDTKDTEVSFGVDATKPNIVVANVESGVTYALESMTVNMSVSDNLLLGSITVYLDDYDKAYKTWTAEEISAIIANNGEFTFDIAGDSKNAHKIKIVSVDVAGNEQIEEITDFFVTTDIWVRYYNNKVLFFGSIAGVIALAGAVVFIIVYRRKRTNK